MPRRSMGWSTPVLCLALAVGLVGCGRETRLEPPPEPAKDYGRPLAPGAAGLVRLEDPAAWPDFYAGLDPLADPGHRRKLLGAIDHSLAWFEAPSSRAHYPHLGIDHDRARASLRAFRDLAAGATDGDAFRETLARDFEVYQSVGWDGRGEVLFTAYCEPIYRGSRTRGGPYQHPLYGLPDDLVKAPDGTPLGRRVGERVVPCPSRAEIEAGDWVAGREIVWLADRFDAFVVHVQGSARIRLEDGSEMRIGYAGKTDRPYTSVGKELVADGRIDRTRISLSAIRRFFAEHPEAMDDYLARNESFVFFTPRQGGPYGSLGVPVTSGCSVATDKSVFPRGALAFVDTTMPIGEGRGSLHRHRAFVLDQDTGGAIRSAGRADLFLGSGPAAEVAAGHVQQEGRLFYVFLRPDSPLLAEASD